VTSFRTPRNPKPSDINAAVRSQLLLLPRDISAKCEGLRHKKPIQNQRLTRTVLNPRSREVWRQTGREREIRSPTRSAQFGGFAAKARRYWAFEQTENGTEKVGPGGTGGEGVRLTTLPHRSPPSASTRREPNNDRHYFPRPPPPSVPNRPEPCYFWGPSWGLKNGGRK
jgi:hypothetical protein